MEISLPYNFEYRDYQKDIVRHIRNGGKRAVLLYHRRGGKDKTMWNLLVEQMIRTKGGYAYVLPTYALGKKIIWDSIDRDGKKFINHIPPELIESVNSQELKITLKNGSFVQILGSENVDTLRGISPRGIVFSEYAFQNPEVWEVMSPMLAENGGWAIFNSTPNGKNHFYDLCEMAKSNPNWFYQKKDIRDTGVISEEYVDEERKSGKDEAFIQQEYYLSFDIGALGSYYGDAMQDARESGRITPLPFDKDIPVNLYFDLGVNDSFTISFVQKKGAYYDFVNYYSDHGKTLEHYFSYIEEWMEENRAKKGLFFLPHDSQQKAHSYLVSGITIFEKFEQRFPNRIKYIKNDVSVNDGIQEARRLFHSVRIDEEKCSELIRCLDNYKKDYDSVKKVFRDKPRHDWASHGADSFRYWAISDKQENKRKPKRVYTPSYSLGMKK